MTELQIPVDIVNLAHGVIHLEESERVRIGSDLFLFYFILRMSFGKLIGFGCNGIGRCGVLYTLYQPCMNISVLDRVCSVYWPPYELSVGLELFGLL